MRMEKMHDRQAEAEQRLCADPPADEHRDNKEGQHHEGQRHGAVVVLQRHAADLPVLLRNGDGHGVARLQDRAVEIAQLVRQLIDLPAVFAGAQLHADGLLADRDVLIVLLALPGVVRDLDDAAADIVRGLLHRRHRHGGRLLRKAIEHQEHDGRRQHPQAAPRNGHRGEKGQHGQCRAACGRKRQSSGVRQPGLAADEPDGEHDAGQQEKQCAQNGERPDAAG